MDREKSKSFDTKQYKRELRAQTSRSRRTTLSCSTLNRPDKFEISKAFTFAYPAPDSSDQESDLRMTRDIQQDCNRPASRPITIPRVQITKSNTMEEDFHSFRESPANSVGDSVYNSPKLPTPSKDFDNVMTYHRKEVKRVKSCDDGGFEDSDAESRESLFPLSCSLPSNPVSPSMKGTRRRVVHFDEATITTTADLGESAARFRMLCRRKKGMMVVPCPRFGESKNIAVQHEEADDIPSPPLDRKDKSKSIFDVCNYSSYGKYS